jgi:hypothetical protein
MNRLAACFGVLALACFAAQVAHADTTFYFDPVNTFSGTAPSGSLTATFSDLLGGGVQLKIDSTLAAGENLDPNKALYFNINPLLDSILSGLQFTLIANTGFSEAANVLTTPDAYKANGIGGYYDILFTYSLATKAFTGGESQTYKITTSSGSISESSFNFISTGGTPSWLAAAHVQNTPSGGGLGGWVGGCPVASPGCAVQMSEASTPVVMATDFGLTAALLAGVFYFRRIRAVKLLVA